MNIGLIGHQGHQSIVLDSLKDSKEHQIVAFAKGSPSDDCNNFVGYLNSLGHKPKVYEDYQEMLDSTSLDIVSTGPQFGLNGKVNSAVIEKRIPLLAEKPIATDLETLDKMEIAYWENPFPLMPMMNFRYSPAFFTAHQLIASGAIGKVCLINAQKSYRLGERPAFFKTRATYGGSIPWVGSHAIDWVMWYAQSDFLSVVATQSTRENGGHEEMESFALCQFRLKNDIMASVNIDYLRPAKAKTHGDDRVRVAGSKGVVEVRDSCCYLINDDHQGEVALESPKRKMFADFIEEVRGNGTSLVNAKDAFSLTRACLVARESADKNKLMEF